jgi:uncharacterized damage-inducible protein DinB
MNPRPLYKSHPLWESAMALTRDAYALSDRLRERSPEAARRLRKAAVAVPAHIAAVVSEAPAESRRHAFAARDALSQVAREAGRLPGETSRRLVRQAETLELSVLFELDGRGANP